jgi:type II secretory pathway pseudopilin PulG
VTLTELLIVIGLMAFLASIALLGLWEAQEVARESRARSQVQRIEALLMERWDDYASRAVPLRISRVNVNNAGNPGLNTNRASFERARVNALRETARFELPDRITDVAWVTYPALRTPPEVVALGNAPALQSGYRRALNVTDGTWTAKFQGAECLYVILAGTYKGEENGLTFFKPSEIGDKDGDGRPEILDPWGNPIEYIRWAPGLDSPLHTVKEVQTISVFGTPTTGQFRLFFSDDPTDKTGPLNWNASWNDVGGAIAGLGYALDGAEAVQGPDGGPWTVRFAAGVNPPLLAVSNDPGDFTLDNQAPMGLDVESVRVTTDFVDPFDPLEAWGGGPPLHPLIVSAGRDGKYGILGLIDPEDTASPPVVNYSDRSFPPAPAPPDPPNNPYRDLGGGRYLGEAYDYGNGAAANRGPSTDNISNHLSDASA